MDTKLLDSQQVITRGNARRDLEGVGIAQSPAATGEGSAKVLDLEPAAGAIVAGERAGRLGEVDGGRALVVDGGVGLEGDGAAGSDGQGLDTRSAGTDVAAEIVGLEVGHGRVVVGVLTDVLPGRVDRGAGADLLKDVVGRGLAGGEEGGGDGELHGGFWVKRGSVGYGRSVEAGLTGAGSEGSKSGLEA